MCIYICICMYVCMYVYVCVCLVMSDTIAHNEHIKSVLPSLETKKRRRRSSSRAAWNTLDRIICPPVCVPRPRNLTPSLPDQHKNGFLPLFPFLGLPLTRPKLSSVSGEEEERNLSFFLCTQVCICTIELQIHKRRIQLYQVHHILPAL